MNQLFIKKIYGYVLFLLFTTIILSGTVSAQTPVGIISNMDGDVQVINKTTRAADFGDDLMLHDKIKVAADSSLVLIYYAQCRQEWFSGKSEIIIGETQSELISGKMEKSELFDCEVPEVVLSDKDSFKKAAFHFRGITALENDGKKQQPSVKPVIEKNIKSLQLVQNKQQNNGIKLKMWTAKNNNSYYRSGEHIIIYFVASKDAYIHLNYFQADGHVVHLIPNLFEDKLHIKAGQIYVVGGNKSKLKLVVEHPYGEETISAIISGKPFSDDFKASEIIEDTKHYKQKINSILSGNNDIAEYALGIWSTP